MIYIRFNCFSVNIIIVYYYRARLVLIQLINTNLEVYEKYNTNVKAKIL